jgi:hypothetical protein
MSRPKPIVILKHIDPKTHKIEEVLNSEAIYAVFYQNKPINLRSLHNLISYPSPKYKKVSFSNPGHAFNLAEKLNKLFKTTDFKVVKLSDGIEIRESEE